MASKPPNQSNLWWGECLSKLRGTSLTPKDISVFWRKGRQLGLMNEELCQYTVESVKNFISERYRTYSGTGQTTSRAQSRPVRRTPPPRPVEYHPYSRIIPPSSSLPHVQHDDIDILAARFESMSSNSSSNSNSNLNSRLAGANFDEDDIESLIELLNEL